MSGDSQKPSNSFCPVCQAELPHGAKFCWLCRMPVSGSFSRKGGKETLGTWALAIFAALIVQFVIAPLLILGAVIIGFAILCSPAAIR